MTQKAFCIAAISLVAAGCGGRAHESAIEARETAAIQTLRTILNAQVQYYSQFGKYAGSLGELGPPTAGVHIGPDAAELIPRDLAAGARNGYRFAIERTPGGFAAVATAEAFGVTGRRSFYTDESMTIRAREGPGAAATDPEIR